jgi:cbb3-type cytochrome oxidase maturation protein
MESLYLLIPISLVFIFIAIRIFFWAVNSGQYDDLDSEGERILFETDEPQEQQEIAAENKIAVKNKRAVKNKKEQT